MSNFSVLGAVYSPGQLYNEKTFIKGGIFKSLVECRSPQAAHKEAMFHLDWLGIVFSQIQI